MAGGRRRKPSVGRVIRVPARIARDDILDTFQIIKDSLDTPKTSGGKSCGFKFFSITLFLIPLMFDLFLVLAQLFEHRKIFESRNVAGDLTARSKFAQAGAA